MLSLRIIQYIPFLKFIPPQAVWYSASLQDGQEVGLAPVLLAINTILQYLGRILCVDF